MQSVLRSLLAGLVSISLSGAPLRGTSKTLGVVLAAEHSQLGAAEATGGATIFDGDVLSTDRNGALRARAGDAQVQLAAASQAILKQASTGVRAVLVGGTLAFSAQNAGAIELYASEARIRPRENRLTQAQVTVVGPKELLVMARKGGLEITVDGETQVVPEATSYRVVINPPETPQRPTGVASRRGPRLAGRSRFVLLSLVITAIVTYFVFDEVFESPASPR